MEIFEHIDVVDRRWQVLQRAKVGGAKVSCQVVDPRYVGNVVCVLEKYMGANGLFTLKSHALDGFIECQKFGRTKK